MNATIIHMSDLHFRENWNEDQDVVLAEFFKDLEKQIDGLEQKNLYMVFSGDFVLKGGDGKLYEKFFNLFDPKLNDLGIPKSRRICVPGNHDISQSVIESDLINHDAVISQNLNEWAFNDYTSNPNNNIFLKKFSNYKQFEEKFSDFGISSDTMAGMGWNIDENIAIYCLNTVFCSSGGVKKGGVEINDQNRLAINTRSLQDWNTKCKAKTKILVMHHPLEWMTNWGAEELKKILRKDFSLCLSGHVHNQEMLHSIRKDISLIECSAPPLLTNKHEDLGYSMITISPTNGVIEITYRQWTKHRTFVSGVNFSNTDNGKVIIRETSLQNEKKNVNSKQKPK